MAGAGLLLLLVFISLRASILAHMTSNVLFQEPQFETWLNFVVGAVP